MGDGEARLTLVQRAFVRRSLLAAAFVSSLLWLAAQPAAAQGSLLDVWTTMYLGYGSRPEWIEDAAWTPSADGRASASFGTSLELLSLPGSRTLTLERSSLRVGRRFGASGHAVRGGLTRVGRSLTTDGADALLGTLFEPVPDVGLLLRWCAGVLGTITTRATGAWWNGPMGSVGVEGENAVYSFRAERWVARTPALELALPTDSVTPAAVGSDDDGWTVEVGLARPSGRVRPSLRARWERSAIVRSPVDRDAFLTFSPEGSLESLLVSVSLRAGATDVTLRRSQQDTELAGVFERLEARAGELFFGRSDFSQWALELRRDTDHARWSWSLGVDEMSAEMSARLETWTFVALWEQLGAIAFRYRGNIDGTARWLRIGRTPVDPAGLRWAVNGGLYELATFHDDWLVTGFGLGRSRQHSSSGGVDPAVVLGGHVGRRLSIPRGVIDASLTGAIPVYGRPVADDPSSGIAWHLGLSLSWTSSPLPSTTTRPRPPEGC